MLLPCGKCLGCRLRQRQDWETRMLMESKTLSPVWFLTLTWNQEYVPGMVRATGEIIRGAVHQWTTGDAPEVSTKTTTAAKKQQWAEAKATAQEQEGEDK